MKELIYELYHLLNKMRDFSAGYSSNTAGDGKMLIKYKGKRYSVKISEIESPADDVFDDIKNL